MGLAIDLDGKTILVCGVSKGGIGGATCRQLARAGARIVALDKEQALIDETLADIESLGGTAHSLVADLYDVPQCEAVIPNVLDRFGEIDGIANIAGGTRADEWMPLDQTTRESFEKSVQLNFAWLFFVCRDAAKRWIDIGRGGAIVNVSSISSLTSAPWHGPYGAAKSAITALTRTMANEWHEFSIRANTVLPGAVLTDRVKSRMGTDAVVAAKPISPCPRNWRTPSPSS
jgi:NAD(P)-dependent dehydrogenase (short-subunit alcohol dehydrogenase family)